MRPWFVTAALARALRAKKTRVKPRVKDAPRLPPGPLTAKEEEKLSAFPVDPTATLLLQGTIVGDHDRKNLVALFQFVKEAQAAFFLPASFTTLAVAALTLASAISVACFTALVKLS